MPSVIFHERDAIILELVLTDDLTFVAPRECVLTHITMKVEGFSKELKYINGSMPLALKANDQIKLTNLLTQVRKTIHGQANPVP